MGYLGRSRLSKQKKCIFIEQRDCPFKAPQIPFETCKVCVEAWKTEVSIKKRQLRGFHFAEVVQSSDFSLPAIDDMGLSQVNEKLREIDELLKNDEIDPMDYIKLRREQIDNLIQGNPVTNIEETKIESNPIPPRQVRVAVITRSFLRTQIITAPENWALPKEITDKVIDTIFKISEEKAPRDIRLRSGGYKIAGIAAKKNGIAVLIIDSDEEFESYEAEIDRLYRVLGFNQDWEKALKKFFD